MTFLNPLYLYGLFGLLVPIAIHIWSKKEGRLIRVGSTQFFPEAESKQSSSLHLNEIWLLILRLLLICTLVFILAQPMIPSSKQQSEQLAFISPQLKDHKQALAFKDSLVNQGYSLKWFTPGFPDIDEEVQTSDTTYFWQLLSDLEELQVANSVIVCNVKLKDVVGKRPMLNTQHSFVHFSNNEANTFLVEAINTDKSRYQVIEGKSSGQVTVFENYSPDENKVTSEDGKLIVEGIQNSVSVLSDTISITIRNDDKYNKDAFFISSAIKTIQAYTKWPIVLSDDENADWLIWLSDNEWPKSGFEQVLRINTRYNSDKLIAYDIQQSEYVLTKRLTSDIVVKENLVVGLLHLLRQNHFNEAVTIANQYDARMIDERQIQPKLKSISEITQKRSSVAPYLWWLLIVLFIVERLVAMIRKQ